MMLVPLMVSPQLWTLPLAAPFEWEPGADRRTACRGAVTPKARSSPAMSGLVFLESSEVAGETSP